MYMTMYDLYNTSLLPIGHRRGGMLLEPFMPYMHRRLLCITYRQRKTNDYIHEKMINLIGKYEPLLSTIKRRNLKYYGHICQHDGLAKTMEKEKAREK